MPDQDWFAQHAPTADWFAAHAPTMIAPPAVTESGAAHLATGPQSFDDSAPLPDGWKDRLNAAMGTVAHPQTFADIGHLIFQPGSDLRGMGAAAGAAVDAMASGATAVGSRAMDLAKNLPADLIDSMPGTRAKAVADAVREWSNAPGPTMTRPTWQVAASGPVPAAAAGPTAAAAVHFTAPEVAQGLAWMKQGLPQEQAIQRILSLRQLQASPSFSISSVMGR